MENINILLIMTDQHRFDCLGCCGNPVIETPNLDWVASEGTIFSNAYTPSPSCIPARACLISGMNQWNTGILGMGQGQGPMGTGFKYTLPGELSKAGYHSQGIGKMHFFPQRSLNGFHNTLLDESGREEDSGFTSDYRKWFDNNKTGDYGFVDHGIDWNSWMARPYHASEFLHPTNWTVNESIQFLEERDPSKPFFLMTSFARPHSPYDAPTYYFDLYLKKEIPMPYVGQWTNLYDSQEDGNTYFPAAWHSVRTDEEIKRARAGYYGSINHIDHQLGRLFMKLKKMGQFDNTMIIFTSDHGDMLGDHHLWRKTYAYEGSAHIPLIIKMPKNMKGNFRKKVNEPVTLYDIMPTVLEAVGIDIPEDLDGKSMLELIKGEEQNWRSYFHGEHSTCYSESQEMQYVTDGKFKFVWLPRIGVEQFFDLEKDPGELKDLSSDSQYESEVIKWRKRLINELKSRNTGLTDGDSLICQKGKPYITSPNYKKRMKESGFDWLKHKQIMI